MTNQTDQPDRELDLFIAEKVMKLIPCDRWTEMNFGSAGGPALRQNCDHENCYSTLEVGSIHGTIGGCPHYSSKIHLAWEVVKRMLSEGFDLRLESAGNGEVWTADFRATALMSIIEEITQDPPGCSSSSVEKAICLAALKAESKRV